MAQWKNCCRICSHTAITSHADVNGVEPRCVHLDYDLVGIVDDGEAGVGGEPQDVIAAVLIDDPGGHGGGASAGATEQPALNTMPSAEQQQPPTGATHH